LSDLRADPHEVDGTEVVARRYAGLLGYELLLSGFGAVAIGLAVLLAVADPAPPALTLVCLCALSALSVRFSIYAGDSAKIDISAQAMISAAAVLAFRSSSPLFGPLVVGMAAAFWRVPRGRHQWFALCGNLGVYGLPALTAAFVLKEIGLAHSPSAIGLCVLAVPLGATQAATNAALVALYFVVYQDVRWRDAFKELAPHLPGAYVPFLFGAIVGELSLRYGLVVFALASATFVMVQVVFSSYRELVESEQAALEGIVTAVERKDPYTAGHSKRVQRYARYMGTQLKWKSKNLARLEQHALMHDIGKLVVPNHILRKPGKLDAAEREIMFRHEEAGAAILGAVPFLAISADIAEGNAHKENFDKDATAAHIVHAADAFDAMTTTRAYRQAHTQDEAFDEMHAKVNKDFHPQCVEALERELDERQETYGLGHEEEHIDFDTPPPKAALGSTLADEAAAENVPMPEPKPREPQEQAHNPHAVAYLVLGVIVGVSALVGAITTSAVAIIISLAALTTIGELLELRPLNRKPRPLAYVVMLVALQALPLNQAVIAIAAGVAVSVVLTRDPKRLLPAAAMIGAYCMGMSTTTATSLITLTTAAFAALATQELIDTEGHVDLTLKNRVADLAILTAGPLVALGTAGTTHTPGLGLGAFAVLVVPLALLTQGYARTQKAKENLFAWIRAMSLAPEYARLVPQGRAEKIAAETSRQANKARLDDITKEQLEAAAWMERVGQCCIDDATPEETANASAEILASSKIFEQAANIVSNDGSTAAKILQQAIALADATPDASIERSLLSPATHRATADAPARG
jgi:hypothetical protein